MAQLPLYDGSTELTSDHINQILDELDAVRIFQPCPPLEFVFQDGGKHLRINPADIVTYLDQLAAEAAVAAAPGPATQDFQWAAIRQVMYILPSQASGPTAFAWDEQELLNQCVFRTKPGGVRQGLTQFLMPGDNPAFELNVEFATDTIPADFIDGQPEIPRLPNPPTILNIDERIERLVSEPWYTQPDDYFVIARIRKGVLHDGIQDWLFDYCCRKPPASEVVTAIEFFIMDCATPTYLFRQSDITLNIRTTCNCGGVLSVFPITLSPLSVDVNNCTWVGTGSSTTTAMPCVLSFQLECCNESQGWTLTEITTGASDEQTLTTMNISDLKFTIPLPDPLLLPCCTQNTVGVLLFLSLEGSPIDI